MNTKTRYFKVGKNGTGKLEDGVRYYSLDKNADWIPNQSAISLFYDSMTDYEEITEKECQARIAEKERKLTSVDKQNKLQVNEMLNILTNQKSRRCKLYLRISLFLWLVTNVSLGPLVFYVAMVFFYVSLFFIILWFRRYRPLKRSIERIVQAEGFSGLERLVVETEMYSNRKVPHLGEEYFFYPSRGLLLKYDEIVWLYMRKTNYNVNCSITLRTAVELMLATSYGKTKPVNLSKEDAAIIESKNPALMVGYSDQNRQIYRDMVKRKSGQAR